MLRSTRACIWRIAEKLVLEAIEENGEEELAVFSAAQVETKIWALKDEYEAVYERARNEPSKPSDNELLRLYQSSKEAKHLAGIAPNGR